MNSSALRVAILKCDSWTASSLLNKFGDIEHQYIHFLGLSGRNIDFKIFNCEKAEFPSIRDNSIKEFDGFLITGSRFSAYDSEPKWIPQLLEFIKQLDQQKKKVVGICFGHQCVAEALGGKVEKIGWNLSHQIINTTSEFQRNFLPNKELRFLAIHQDQVVKLPPNIAVWSSNDKCKVQGMVKGSHIMTIQSHPEFRPEMFKLLLEAKKDVIPSQVRESALKTVDLPTDSELLSHMIVQFLSS